MIGFSRRSGFLDDCFGFNGGRRARMVLGNYEIPRTFIPRSGQKAFRAKGPSPSQESKISKISKISMKTSDLGKLELACEYPGSRLHGISVAGRPTRPLTVGWPVRIPETQLVAVTLQPPVPWGNGWYRRTQRIK
jgi:hypothetical protein